MFQQPVVITVENVVKRYEDINAINSLSLQVHEGEIYGLLGPNGAGKSTLIKCMAGLLRADTGTISMLGHNPAIEPNKVKAMIGYVPEEMTLFRSLTPSKIIDLVASVRDLDPGKTKQRCLDLLDILDASNYFKTQISRLSKGNQQKIQIILALIHEPKILLLDEPLTSLDMKTRYIVKDMLKVMASQGCTILLSTHVIEEAESTCTRIGIINNGKLLIEGPVSELQNRARLEMKSLESMFISITGEESNILSKLRKFNMMNKSKS